MRIYPSFILAIATLLGNRGWAAEPTNTPVVWQEIPVPDALLQITEIDGQPLTFGGDIRIGDLDGDGEIVVLRSTDNAMKPCFLGAFDLDGNVLWQIGSGGDQPARPGPVTLYDFNGDGADEVHQRPLIANFRGTARARDFVVKLGERVIAFDDSLHPLWHDAIPWNECSQCSAYIPAIGDIDHDGRDEVTGGYYLLDDNGDVMWARQLGPNMDSVSIAPWDHGQPRVIASGGGDVLDAAGGPIIHLGSEIVPHGQEVRVGDFDPTSPGLEMIIRWNGHRPDAITVSQSSEILHRFTLNDSPNHTGMETVFWHGRTPAPLLYNGGMRWNGQGERIADLPGLPPPVGPKKMGGYHAIPADLLGDNKEELVIYNP